MVAFDATRMIGDMSGWAQGIAQPTVSVTDLSMHNDDIGVGVGAQQSGGSNANAAAQSVKVMHTSAAIVLVAIALLWLGGTVVFKGARLP